jgi:hypothetical protein
MVKMDFIVFPEVKRLVSLVVVCVAMSRSD